MLWADQPHTRAVVNETNPESSFVSMSQLGSDPLGSGGISNVKIEIVFPYAKVWHIQCESFPF
jgi:hypothetical protein